MENILIDSELESLAKDLSEFKWSQYINRKTEQLAELALSFCENSKGKFSPAGIGKNRLKHEEVRRDQTLWLDEKIFDELGELKTLYESLQAMAREKLFLPIKSFECHFSYYGKGAFYLKHRDRHKGSDKRLLTVLLYLNDLEKEQGGALRLFNENGGEALIQPEKGKLVIFDSELEHEVITSHVDRWAISGWLRSDL